ncbi:MAG: sigma-70 family RNA polymerase sigma factor [Patescibacteria group bacterium]
MKAQADQVEQGEPVFIPEKAAPFFDKALGDFLRKSMTGALEHEDIEAALREYRAGSPEAANELVRTAIGVPLIVGYYHVKKETVSKQEVLEAAPNMVLEAAESGAAEGYVSRLADLAERHWQEATQAPPGKSAVPDAGFSADNRRNEMLVTRALEGNEDAFEALAERMQASVDRLAHTYFAPGLSKDDIAQEARYGLLKAVRDYRRSGKAGFVTFAELAMYRQVITAVKTATRDKHLPVNEARSFRQPVGTYSDGEEIPLSDVLADSKVLEPDEIIEQRRLVRDVFGAARSRLTDVESGVIIGHYVGHNYTEIGEVLGIDHKAVDNAMQRARRKLQLAVEY